MSVPLTEAAFAEAIEATNRRAIAGEGLIRITVRQEAAELRYTAGWLAISLACWLLLAGAALLRSSR